MKDNTLDNLKLDMQHEIDVLNTLISTAQRELRYNNIELSIGQRDGFDLRFMKIDETWLIMFEDSNENIRPIMECPLDIKLLASSRIYELFEKKKSILLKEVYRIRSANNFLRDSLKQDVM